MRGSGSHCSLEGLERNENRPTRRNSGTVTSRTFRVAGVVSPTSLNGFSLRSRIGARQSSEGESLGDSAVSSSAQVKSGEHETRIDYTSRSHAQRSSSVRSLEEIANSSGGYSHARVRHPTQKSGSLPSLGNISTGAMLRNADMRQRQQFDHCFSLQSMMADDGHSLRNEAFSISNERRKQRQPHPQGSTMKLLLSSADTSVPDLKKKPSSRPSQDPAGRTGTTSPTFVGDDGKDGSSITPNGNDSFEALALAAGVTTATTMTTTSMSTRNLSRREQLMELFDDQLSDREFE